MNTIRKLINLIYELVPTLIMMLVGIFGVYGAITSGSPTLFVLASIFLMFVVIAVVDIIISAIIQSQYTIFSKFQEYIKEGVE